MSTGRLAALAVAHVVAVVALLNLAHHLASRG